MTSPAIPHDGARPAQAGYSAVAPQVDTDTGAGEPEAASNDRKAIRHPTRRAAAWTLPLAPALAWAVLMALLLSTQFLAQVFVWLHWPVAEVLEGWVFVLRDRLVVALAIALLIVAFGRLPVASDVARAAWLAAAIVLGALGGELALHALDDRPLDNTLFAGAAARWTLMATVLAAMYWLWRGMVRSREAAQRETLRRIDGESQLAQARLAALQSQIEPHFLFNTLATVRRLQRTGPGEGAAMLASFVGYLRQTMALLDRREVRLDAELELVREYLAVIGVRMGGRLGVHIDVPAALHGALLPPLALATLVENAIKHGLTPAPEGGTLLVRAFAEAGFIDISVADTGVGFGSAKTGGSGLGLSNVRARLRALHGEATGLHLAANAPSGVVATMRLPLRSAEVSES